MHAMKDQFDLACAMTPTVSSQEMLREHMPGSLVYSELREDVVAEMLRLNRELAPINKQKSILLIFDDLSYDKSIFRCSKTLLDLAKNGRHCKITWALVVQAPYDIPPDIRSSCDWVFLTREPILQAMKKSHEAYGGVVDYKTYTNLMRHATADYGILCLNQTCTSYDVTESITWTRAPASLPPFTVCRKSYWTLEKKGRPREKEEGSTLAVSVVGARGARA
jgi:hypothetical protein|eukprot:7391696-Prymnesium_polylepis.2